MLPRSAAWRMSGGLLQVVEGDVEGPGEVACGVFARGADVQDDQFVETGAGLVCVEGVGAGHDAVLRRCRWAIGLCPASSV